MFVHYTLVLLVLLSGHLLGNSCLLGWPYVLIVFCLFVIFILLPILILSAGFGFFKIAPVSVHCFSITFVAILNF